MQIISMMCNSSLHGQRLVRLVAKMHPRFCMSIFTQGARGKHTVNQPWKHPNSYRTVSLCMILFSRDGISFEESHRAGPWDPIRRCRALYCSPQIILQVPQGGITQLSHIAHSNWIILDFQEFRGCPYLVFFFPTPYFMQGKVLFYSIWNEENFFPSNFLIFFNVYGGNNGLFGSFFDSYILYPFIFNFFTLQ